MKESHRWFDWGSYLGKTVEISLENGAVYRGSLRYNGLGDNYWIDGKEGSRHTHTTFDNADVVSITDFD